jgi:oligosaccharyltransferase complex subunit epsilon
MAPKKQKGETANIASSSRSRSSSVPSQSSSTLSHFSVAANDLWKSYWEKTPNSLLIIDAFLVFLMYVGGVQFLYACLTGGYPFNSFLSGFSAAVGQFVLAGNTHSTFVAN